MAGLREPEEEYDKENPAVIEKYTAYRNAERRASEESEIVLVEHCKSECSMYILGIKESFQSPRRGEVERLGQRIEAKPEWREILKTFCERAEIPFTEPEWLLAPFSE